MSQNQKLLIDYLKKDLEEAREEVLYLQGSVERRYEDISDLHAEIDNLRVAARVRVQQTLLPDIAEFVIARIDWDKVFEIAGGETFIDRDGKPQLNKIPIVKGVREVTGFGLLSSKLIVDHKYGK